jgi:hypothetical protein
MERHLTYDRFISHHRNKLDVKKFPEDKLNMAYLDEKFKQFTIHLSESDDSLIIKTLKEINNQLQDGDEVFAYSIRNNQILKLIFKHLKDNSNNEIRINSALCFKQFCRLNPSRELLNKFNYISSLESIFDDKEERVRLYTVEGLIFYTSFREGQEVLLENKVLQQVIKKVDNEKNEMVLNNFLILANELLKAEGASKLALNCNYVKILKKHINYTKAKLRISVFINLGSLSMSEQGKEICTNEGDLIKNALTQITQQIDLLQIKNKPNYYYELDTINMLIALTRFCNAVSILKIGKVEIFENKGLESYLTLLKISNNDQIILNSLQVICNTSEEPRARKFMLNNISDIEVFLKNKNELVKAQAEMTKNTIVWKP